MRKLLLVLLLFVGMCFLCITTNSCSDKKPDQDSLFADSLAIDSSLVDTMEAIISETPMPKAADELFDDFIFNFAANKKLQLKRIVFPLPETTGDKTTYIEKRNWPMEHFFMRQDFYTLIFDNRRQMEATKDTSINHVVVEKIYLHKNHVKQYIFDRPRGEWMLTSINNTTFKGLPNESFLAFYNKFVSDSTFQMNSIAEELHFSGPDPDDDFSTMEGVLIPEQWPSFAPPLPKGMIYNIIYGSQGKGSNQKLFVITGIANGLQTELTFQKKGGKWTLVRLNI